ncbi:hypothetical protein B0H12DRAFT_429439 [Mycena haematopus]|nr:hypothetical protein B0H12DRAFT_429439 [Mycena haematopus]
MTCVQMHKPSLSMLLSRRNIPNPLDTVDIQLHAMSNTLQVLRTALFVPTIRRLLLRFSTRIFWNAGPFLPLSVSQLQETTDHLLEEMRQLRRLFTKLQSVDEIILILPGSLEWNLRDVNLERGETSDILPWSHVISFFQHAVEQHCSSFTVETSPFQNKPRFPPLRATTRSLSGLFRKVPKRNRELDMSALARCDGVKYLPQTGPATARTGSSIRYFHIRTTLLLFPGAAGWTFSTLRNSPIVSLHISGLSISRWDWDLIAPKLSGAVPNLLELDFDDREIHPDCFMEMLRGFSRLTSLTIGPHMFVDLRYPRLFPLFSGWFLPAFRNLVKLSAPWSYVQLFLMRPNPLSALSQLELPPSTRTDSPNIIINSSTSTCPT